MVSLASHVLLREQRVTCHQISAFIAEAHAKLPAHLGSSTCSKAFQFQKTTGAFVSKFVRDAFEID